MSSKTIPTTNCTWSSAAVFVTALLALAPASRLQAQTVSVIQTTPDQTRLFANLPSANFGTGGHGSYTLQVNDTRQYQQWDGVGAGMTDSSNYLLWKVITKTQRDALMQDLFTPSGAGFDIIRMPIGASDSSASGDYSYDDLPAGQTDPYLTKFSIAHDLSSTIPAAQAAFAVNQNIKVFALPWSPPGWMKDSGQMNGGHLLPQYFGTLADYIVDFVKDYSAQNIPIYALTVQTEPGVNKTVYPSMDLPAPDEATIYTNYLAPKLKAAGYGGIKLIAYDWNWDNPSYPEAVLSSAGNVVAGTSWHCYSDTSGEGAEREVAMAYPGKDVWFTECTGQLGENFGYSLQWWAQHLLITNVRNGGKSVIDWTIALDQNGGPQVPGGCPNCLGAVTIDTRQSPPAIVRNAEYYALGQIGKVVRPGAYNIATDSQGAGGIQSVGFKNADKSIGLLVLNGTSATSTVTISWSGKSFDYPLPAGSVTTFKWQGQ